jgi:hypothetical protein
VSAALRGSISQPTSDAGPTQEHCRDLDRASLSRLSVRPGSRRASHRPQRRAATEVELTEVLEPQALVEVDVALAGRL